MLAKTQCSYQKDNKTEQFASASSEFYLITGLIKNGQVREMQVIGLTNGGLADWPQLCGSSSFI